MAFSYVALLLPPALILARTSAFVSVLPLLGGRNVPNLLKAGLAVLLTIFLAHHAPAPPPAAARGGLVLAGVLLGREALCGLALGLAVRLVYSAVQQGGILIGRQMGFYMASIVDPSTNQQTQPLGMFFEVMFILLFFAAGGHHLLIRLIARSFGVLPAGGALDFGALTMAVLTAGSTMLLLALKLAAPMLAAFLVLAVVLAVLARVLPEMNVLLTSLPLRVAVGLGMALALAPSLSSFTEEIGDWIGRLM